MSWLSFRHVFNLQNYSSDLDEMVLWIHSSLIFFGQILFLSALVQYNPYFICSSSRSLLVTRMERQTPICEEHIFLKSVLFDFSYFIGFVFICCWCKLYSGIMIIYFLSISSNMQPHWYKACIECLSGLSLTPLFHPTYLCSSLLLYTFTSHTSKYWSLEWILQCYVLNQINFHHTFSKTFLNYSNLLIFKHVTFYSFTCCFIWV
jgi:hypothetical protein